MQSYPSIMLYLNIQNLITIVLCKKRNKVYYNHSGYPGGLKKTSFSELISRKPQDVLYRAVKGMLPHNRLGRQLIKKVKIYSGSKHPHIAQIQNEHEIKSEV